MRSSFGLLARPLLVLTLGLLAHPVVDARGATHAVGACGGLCADYCPGSPSETVEECQLFYGGTCGIGSVCHSREFGGPCGLGRVYIECLGHAS